MTISINQHNSVVIAFEYIDNLWTINGSPNLSEDELGPSLKALSKKSLVKTVTDNDSKKYKNRTMWFIKIFHSNIQPWACKKV